MHETESLPTVPLARGFVFDAITRGIDRQCNHSYGDALRRLGEAHTLNDFFAYFNHIIPKPSVVFDGVHAMCIEKKQLMYGLCIFEMGTRPEWEDVQNINGAELVARVSDLSIVDDVWFDVISVLLNDDARLLTGVRMIQKSDRRNAFVKFELWLRDAATRASVEHEVRARIPKASFGFVGRRAA